MGGFYYHREYWIGTLTECIILGRIIKKEISQSVQGEGIKKFIIVSANTKNKP